MTVTRKDIPPLPPPPPPSIVKIPGPESDYVLLDTDAKNVIGTGYFASKKSAG